MSNEGSGRRLSFGALLLLTLGVLLLANNFVEDFRAVDLFAKYWPVLLILWGLVKLIDNLQARSAGQPAPKSLTAGDVFLLIIVILAGFSLAGVKRLRIDHPNISFGPTENGCMVWMGERSYPFDEEVTEREVKPGAQFRLQTSRGAIRVTPGEGNKLRVTAKKSVCGTSEAKARESAELANIEIVEEGSGYLVRPKAQTWDRTLQVDLELSVPKKAALTARAERGNVTVTGVEGNVAVTAERGDVEVTGVAGDVEVEVRGSGSDTMIRNVKGNVKLTGRGGEVDVAEVGGNAYVQGEFFGGIKFAAIGKEARFLSRRTDLTIVDLKGRIEIGGGTLRVEDANGAVALVSRERDIELDKVRGAIRIENKNAGDIDIRFTEAPRADVTVMADRGNVTVAMPANAGFEVSAFSRNGEVDSEFSGPELKNIEANRDRNIEGRIGTKGPKLTLRTSYGTIRLRKEG